MLNGAPFMEMVYIPAGGVTTTGSPVLGAEVAPYRIGKFEVTNRQFLAFVEATGFVTTAEREGRGGVVLALSQSTVEGVSWRQPYPRMINGGLPYIPLEERWDEPVTMVSWEDATAFCAWLSRTTGRRFSLPTETQWDRAAQGLPTPPRSWPRQMADVGPEGLPPMVASLSHRLGPDWYADPDGYLYAAPVGRFPTDVSTYGCHDMLGNVAEWCRDLLGGADDISRCMYHGDPVLTRIVRGGDFGYGPAEVAPLRRIAACPRCAQSASPYGGFRVVLED